MILNGNGKWVMFGKRKKVVQVCKFGSQFFRGNLWTLVTKRMFSMVWLNLVTASPVQVHV